MTATSSMAKWTRAKRVFELLGGQDAGNALSIDAGSRPEILELTATDTTTVETCDEECGWTVMVMVDDHAVASSTDNNGPAAADGDCDLSGLGISARRAC